MGFLNYRQSPGYERPTYEHPYLSTDLRKAYYLKKIELHTMVRTNERADYIARCSKHCPFSAVRQPEGEQCHAVVAILSRIA